VSTPLPSGLIRTFTLKSTTRLTATSIFIQRAPSRYHPARPEIVHPRRDYRRWTSVHDDTFASAK
jgi:hypothetical protein